MKVCLACEMRFESNDWRCPGCGRYPEQENGYLSFSPVPVHGSDSFDADFFKRLFSLESGHFWFRARNQLLIWALHRYFARAKSFLEIGCGTGFVLSGIQQQFPEVELYGSEIFTNGLDFAARRLPEVTLYQMDARRIPFDGEFDVIGAFDVLEHIEEDVAVLLQLYQATKPGGGIMLTVPQHRFLWSKVDEDSFHKRRYARAELLGKVKQAGFEILHITSFVSLLVPLMWLSRRELRRSKEKFDHFTALKIHPLLNAILEKVMDIERVMIKKRISWPVGGSLLVIAKRPIEPT